MNYPIHPDFAKISKPSRALPVGMLPAVNALMGLTGCKRQKAIRMEKLRIPVSGGNILLRVFSPRSLTGCAPCLVYFHGGGFAIQAARHHYDLAQTYALEAGCRVVFVDYRLAVKHPFPVPVQDCFAAYRWVCDHAAQLNMIPHKIAVGGDSAGGCLAAACVHMAKDQGLDLPCFQLLVYPVTDRRMQTASMAAFPDTPMWNSEKNKAMWQLYLPQDADSPIHYASPMEAPSFRGLPDAYVETAEFDCLRDEAAAYAVALQKGGSHVEINMTKGTVHGFDYAQNSTVTTTCVERRCMALRRAFSKN